MMDVWTPPTVVTSERMNHARLDPDYRADKDWLLTREDSQASALSLVRPDGVSLTIDFTAGKARYRTTQSGMGAQALSRALGVKQFKKINGYSPTIVDATGGLGQDAWALASTGCTLILIEQHDIVHALLADGLERALANDECAAVAKRITLLQGEATEKLDALPMNNVHAIYLDPMYPERRKKANSKKGMQFLHALLGPPSTNDPALLLAALDSGVSRVVVKRPKGAPLLAGTEQFRGQRTVIESPNTRYDVYHSK
ncbi:MAG: class I SAM-dependent methyltransferase [Granulosicoccus sp.]